MAAAVTQQSNDKRQVKPMMEAVRLEKTDKGTTRTSLFDTVLPPLVNASAPKQFVF